ncbi:MAG TPA: zinc ribbon domain-containing protein [Chloroflexota bacterium]|nr:zinc ribbon domain-containing protein [Chloroflexota bacterium]
MPQGLETIIQVVLALVGAYAAAFWFCLVVWTFRDIQQRSRDVVVQVLATALVLLFNVPGLILYTILRPPETLAEAYARSLEEESLIQDIEERQSCPGCKRRVQPDFIVCPTCRARLKQPCTSCGRLLQLNWRVCPYCGIDVATEAPSPSTSTRVHA